MNNNFLLPVLRGILIPYELTWLGADENPGGGKHVRVGGVWFIWRLSINFVQ